MIRQLYLQSCFINHVKTVCTLHTKKGRGPHLHEQTNSRNEGTVKLRVEDSYLEIESALVFTDLESITIRGCFWGHRLHLLLL